MFLRLLRWLLIEPTPSAPAELAPRFLAPITDRDAALPPAPSLPDLGAGPGCGYCAPEWPCREHAGFGPGEGPKFCDCQFPEDCQNGCEWLTAEQAEELGPGDVDDDGCLWLAPDDELPEGFEWVEEDAMGPIGAMPEPESAPDDRPPHPEGVDRDAPPLTLHDLDYALAFLARVDNLSAHAAFLDRP